MKYIVYIFLYKILVLQQEKNCEVTIIMHCSTRSLRLATCLRVKTIHKQYITCIQLNTITFNKWSCSSSATFTTESIPTPIISKTNTNPSNILDDTHSTSVSQQQTPPVSYSYGYEIRLGPVVENISETKLSQLTQACSDQCMITKSRNSKALYLQSNNEDDIATFQSLVHEQFLQVSRELHCIFFAKLNFTEISN